MTLFDTFTPLSKILLSWLTILESKLFNKFPVMPLTSLSTSITLFNLSTDGVCPLASWFFILPNTSFADSNFSVVAFILFIVSSRAVPGAILLNLVKKFPKVDDIFDKLFTLSYKLSTISGAFS